MKKVIVCAALAAGLVATGFSQGTITFQNATGGIGLVEYNGVPASGLAVNLELFYGPAGSTLSQLLAGGTGIGDVIFSTTTYTASIAGEFYDGSTVTTLEPAGNGSGDASLNVELAVAGWTGSANSYAAAVAAGAPVGVTAAFANPTGGGGSPAAAAANMVKWLPGNPLLVAVPEPTTLALGGLGAAALLLFRRRK
jgi:hypothetical protein